MTSTPRNDVLSYTRVVDTADGASAFVAAELHLGSQPGPDGVPAMLMADIGPASGAAFVRFAAFPEEPHPAAAPQWVVVLRGVIEVEVSDGTTRRFGAGELVLATDTSGRGHITRAVGEEPVEALGITTTRLS